MLLNKFVTFFYLVRYLGERGEKMDFEETYRNYFHNVYLFVCSLTSDRNLAEEVTQETFLKAMQALNKFDGEKDILAWLFTIARNTYFSHCRKQKLIADEPVPERCEDTVLERMIDQEQAYLIYEYMHGMKEPYKEVFTLRVLGELPFDKIGRLFGKSDGWARVTYYRAKKMIADYMEGLK